MNTNDFQVGSFMVKYPYTVDRKLSAEKAMKFMKSCRIRHLPVVQNEELVGVVSERDLREILAAEGRSSTCVEEVMTSNVFVIDRATPLSQVVQTMANNKYGCALVRDMDREVVGIFTTTDALHLLAKFLRDGEEENLNLVHIEDYFFGHQKQCVV